MPKLLIDPLTSSLQMAIAQDGVVLKLSESKLADKPVALEACFASLGKTAFEEIVMVNGPGNFTSLRVAIGFARGLAQGLNIKTRGVGVFEVDYACMDTNLDDLTIYRDARGGRFYEAQIEQGKLAAIKLVRELHAEGWSAEKLEGARFIDVNPIKRMEFFACLAEKDIGESPARAKYVRPPDAAVSSEKALVILDE